MHETAMEFGRRFFDAYVKDKAGLVIADIGAQDFNGSLKSLVSSKNKYIGVDSIAGKGVDIVINDPYTLPFESNSIDVCLSSSCFEHSEFFWLIFNEILRVLKPEGLLYLNVPSNGTFHRFPIDCWRFYPNSGLALQNWGNRNGYKTVLLESFTGLQGEHMWNDFVAVYVKDARFVTKHKDRILNNLKLYFNGYVYGENEVRNLMEKPQDLMAHSILKNMINSYQAIINEAKPNIPAEITLKKLTDSFNTILNNAKPDIPDEPTKTVVGERKAAPARKG